MADFSRTDGEDRPVREFRKVTRKKRPSRSASSSGPDVYGVPSGYDPDLWHLALGFQQGAEHYGVGLSYGVPVIYMEMKRRLDKDTALRDHPNMVKFVERMIVVFWNQLLPAEKFEDALHEFVNKEVWEATKRAVQYRAKMARLEEDIQKGRVTLRKRVRPPRRQQAPRPRRDPEPSDTTKESSQDGMERMRARWSKS